MIETINIAVRQLTRNDELSKKFAQMKAEGYEILSCRMIGEDQGDAMEVCSRFIYEIAAEKIGVQDA